ncbi:F390 synthetase-related protein [Vibrio rhizosphaerae]|uniref:F390 synthetase-related protein n=1 Tax=Vibrio rhizosphaerae TaxID=398736 RepID=UPI00056E21F1|nr:F390 synthetase-related protein [Vibrio rhizosphaerae]
MIPLLRQFAFARYHRFASREQLLSWQNRQLERHLKWVCEHSPFYQSLRNQPLAAFPVMNKALMMAHLDAINTRGLKTEQLMSVALNAEQSRRFEQSVVNGVTVGLSSGTSGQRGLFLADPYEKQLWAGNILGKLLPGLWQKHRIALALRANSPLYKSVAKGPIQFFYADLNQPHDVWIRALDRFQPTLLIGSAQALQFCAMYSGTFGEPKMSPARIISGAEVLTPVDRALIEQAFSGELHEVYQCTEGFLACTDAQKQMRWNQDIVHIEKHWLNPEKTHYSPIITDFRRRTQPIIRYQLDDVIAAQHDDAPFEPLGAIAGRCGDCLRIGEERSQTVILPDLIYRAVTLAIAERVDYRITQTSSQCLTIEALPSFHDRIRDALSGLLQNLGAGAVRFEYAPPPDWNPMNKQRRVVNLCEF